MESTDAARPQPSPASDKPKSATAQVVEVVIRLGILLGLVVWSFTIVRPFIGPLVWAAIISVGCYPLVDWLAARLGGRYGWAATVFTLTLLAGLLVPSLTLGIATTRAAQRVSQRIERGDIDFPLPNERLKEIPAVGEPLFSFWKLATTNTEEALRQVSPQLQVAAEFVLQSGLSLGLVLLQFVFSIILAGFLMAKAEGTQGSLLRVARRLDPKNGERLVDLSKDTVRSVLKGVVGIAVLQATLAGIGMAIAGVPMPGLWAGVVLALCISQVGPALLLIPLSLYVFGDLGVGWGSLFLIYNVVVSLVDNVLKPIVMGAGVEAPIVVVFVGTLGGLLSMGLLGMFVGPVVLVLFWTLLQEWLAQVEGPEAQPAEDEVVQEPEPPAPASRDEGETPAPTPA